jgi:Mannosyl-glycoprotein endo-beta-N-acetylglucosaminidase
MGASAKWDQLVLAYRDAAVPAPAVKAVTLAQWMLESSRGTSELALQHNNFAGLRYVDDMSTLAARVRVETAESDGAFCTFTSIAAFMQGYWLFIQRPHFAGWQRFEDDPARFIDFIAERGFSTDPFYGDKVKALLPEAQLMLRTGGGIDPSEPRRYDRMAFGPLPTVELTAGLDPDFRYAADIRHTFRGARPAGLEGAVIRLDECPRAPLHGPDDAEWGARQTLKWTAKQGSATAAISRSGAVHLPANHDWRHWGHHAGQGLCPRTGRGALSQRLASIDVNGPGKVYPTADHDIFVPWYNAVATTKAGPDGAEISLPALDDAGRAKPIRLDWEVYRRRELRKAPPLRPGAPETFHAPMTGAQYAALIQLLMYLKRSFADSFRPEFIYGQDELTPQDMGGPGPALGAMAEDRPGPADSMPRFRAQLRQRWLEEQLL